MGTFSIKELENVKNTQDESTKNAWDALETKRNIGELIELRNSERYEMPFIISKHIKINGIKTLVYVSSFNELSSFVFKSEAEANLANSLFIASYNGKYGFNVNEFRFTLESVKRMIGIAE